MNKILAAMILMLLIINTARTQELPAARQAVFDKVIAWHHNNPECGPHPGGAEFKEYVQLAKDIALVLVTCEIGTDQVNWMAYAAFLDDEDPTISQLSFATTDGKHWTADIRIGQPEWDEEAKTLTTTNTQDMAESCGFQNIYKWRRHSFYLMTTYFKPCPGDEAGRKTTKSPADHIPVNDNNWPQVFSFQRK